MYVYKYISLVLNNMTGILPFSLGEVLVLSVPVLLLGYVIYVIIKTVKAKGKRVKKFLDSLLNIVCVGAVCLFLFTMNCGINYYRSGIGELMEIKTEPVSAEELYRVCVYLAEKASEVRENLREDENGVMILSENANERAARCVNEFLGSHYAKPKNVMCSRGMSYLNITGIYFPFTFEANVNIDVPDFSIPSTMCHELAHVNGIMHEEDANFIAFAACIDSEDKEMVYSGYMLSMIYASNALYEADKEKYREFSGYISEGVRRDLAAQSEYWKEFETPVAEAAANVNDSYLKSNAQSDGIKSYGNMVDLTIGYLRDKMSK